MAKNWNWKEIPAEYEECLKTLEQRETFKLLRAGMTFREIARKQRVAGRNLASKAARIKDQILEAMASKTGAKVVQYEVEQITEVEEHRLKQQNKMLVTENKLLKEQVAQNEALLSITDGAKSPNVKPLKIKTTKGKKHQVAATAFLSDTHFDEVVSLAMTGGANEYSREIAVKRLETFTEKTILVARDLMSGFDVVHLDLPFGGDMVSGNIHDELARTNEAEIMDTVDFWSERLAEVVVTMSMEFSSVFIPAVVGNHGRNTHKPRHKGRIRDNFDWSIYRNVARIIKQHKISNVRFDISESTDCLWTTMGHKYLLTHGDQASGGAGWGGIFSPIMRLYEKKLKAYASRGESFDTLMMGHWHTFTDAGSVIVNGSLKGYDEFAHNLNFRAEPPQQAFWLTDPRHGKIFSGPLFVDDYKDGKRKKAA